MYDCSSSSQLIDWSAGLWFPGHRRRSYSLRTAGFCGRMDSPPTIQCATYYSTCRRSVRQEDPACRCRGPQGAMVLILQQHIVTLSSASGAFIVPSWRYTLVTNKCYHKISDVLLLLSVVEESVVVRNGSTMVMVMVRWWCVGWVYNFPLKWKICTQISPFAFVQIDLHKCKLICICANWFA
jgi:hypothetical protein